jgi:hypothetical protein
MLKPLVDYSKPRFCGCGSSIRSAGVSVELMNVAQRSARGRSPCAAAPSSGAGKSSGVRDESPCRPALLR